MMMKNNAPVIVDEPTVLKLSEIFPVAEPNSEPDPEMMEIEEAKKHFNDQPDIEAYWAGRLLANRKSTRFAA